MIKYGFYIIHVDTCFHLCNIYEERWSTISTGKVKKFQEYLWTLDKQISVFTAGLLIKCIFLVTNMQTFKKIYT